MSTYKILGAESAVNSTPSSFANTNVVRIVETGTGNALITQKNASNTVVGSITLRLGTEMTLVKNRTDTLEASGAGVVLATPVTYWV